ncbi:MAG: Maf family protein [Gemmatimonadota bacterium]
MPGSDAPFVLASASPRRSAILDTLGIEHLTMPAGVAEDVRPGELPEVHAERLARTKASHIARTRPDSWVLGGDTVVTRHGEILGKPEGAGDAVEMLLKLQGGVHQVVSGLCLVPPSAGSLARRRAHSGITVTSVRFRAFDRETARAYAATGEPMGKAGAYAIQGQGAALVEAVDGDYFGVVGLPVSLLVRLLEEVGRPYRFGP